MYGSITQLKKASRQLFKSRVCFHYNGPKGEGFEAIQMADRVWAPWVDENYDPVLVQGYKVHLHELFYDYVTQVVYPLDWDILRALRRSALGVDLYVWLAYRVFTLKEPVIISWEQLHWQMGHTYDDSKNFARRAKRELKRIKLVWPKLEYETPRGRLILRPSEPSITPKK